jgi:Protein of unknown function (DUF4233)
VRRLCSTVLGMEAVILLLAIVPAKVLEHIPGGTAAMVGGGLALLAIFFAGFVGRRRWALYAGSVLQLLVIASGVMIPAMYALGAIFAALWFTGIWLARKVESAQRARESASAAHGAPTPAP